MVVDVLFAFVCGLGVGFGIAFRLVMRYRAERTQARDATARMHGALVGIATVSHHSLCRATNEWDDHLADLIDEHAALAQGLLADGVPVDGANASSGASGVPVVLRRHHPNCAYADLPGQPANCSCPPIAGVLVAPHQPKTK
jgi:hypothetical protein